MADVEHMNLNGDTYDISDAVARGDIVSLGETVDEVKENCESEIAKISEQLNVETLTYGGKTYGYKWGNLIHLSFYKEMPEDVVSALQSFNHPPAIKSRFLAQVFGYKYYYVGWLDYDTDGSMTIYSLDAYGGTSLDDVTSDEETTFYIVMTYFCA